MQTNTEEKFSKKADKGRADKPWEISLENFIKEHKKVMVGQGLQKHARQDLNL